jgi:hypothetical protein
MVCVPFCTYVTFQYEVYINIDPNCVVWNRKNLVLAPSLGKAVYTVGASLMLNEQMVGRGSWE